MLIVFPATSTQASYNKHKHQNFDNYVNEMFENFQNSILSTGMCLIFFKYRNTFVIINSGFCVFVTKEVWMLGVISETSH